MGYLDKLTTMCNKLDVRVVQFCNYEELKNADGVPYFQLVFCLRLHTLKKIEDYKIDIPTVYKSYERDQLKGILNIKSNTIEAILEDHKMDIFNWMINLEE